MPFDGKAMLKGGWHPSNDRAIKKETWKSDLKGIATGKKKDPYEEQRNHISTPLTSLRDPDSFGPPPKARSYYDADGRPLNSIEVERKKTGAAAGSSLAAGIPQSLSQIPTEHRGGLGAPVVETGYRERRQREMEEREKREQEELIRERSPYKKDTTGIDTRNFAPPPKHYAVGSEMVATAGRPTPALPPRVPPRQTALPPPPLRQTTGSIASQSSGNSGPPPFLPPRQNEYPDEHTPAPPPTYGEALNAPSPPAQPMANKFETAATNAATKFGSQAASSWMQQRQQQQGRDPAAINQGAASRLAGAGVSVPGFGIGKSNTTSGQQQLPIPSAQQVQSAASFASGAAARFGSQNQPGQGQGVQLNQLQQRFARMGTGGSSSSPAGQESGVVTPASLAQKKSPPPPPPKKAGLQPGPPGAGADNGQAPPPVPMGSKPKW
ncbi:hypothetical protein CERZMDRAFT_81284 [Cercospora zeae-maydis SCOH1-5]|uniref:Uncharacterized protein n=1 Tax=Cercospora zeae-maydis SCOH1-5 TaxID=717836 RepID=A0A6A6FSH7_9PEZI|nr:hypothetical protein CERZMDRAFT_81284 [Cercospora zeae-maydis SCOH1-5]